MRLAAAFEPKAVARLSTNSSRDELVDNSPRASKLIARLLLSTFLLSLPGSREVWAQVARVSPVSLTGAPMAAPGAGLQPSGAALISPSLTLSAPSLALSPSAPSLTLAPAAPVALGIAPTAPAAAKADPRTALKGAAAVAAALTPKTGGAAAKDLAGRAFEGAFEGASARASAASGVAGVEGAGTPALSRNTAATGKPGTKLRRFGGGGSGGGSAPAGKNELLAGIRAAYEPGKIVSYAKIGEIGKGLGMSAARSGVLFTELIEEGHFGVRDNRDPVYFSFRQRAKDSAQASDIERAVDIIAARAVMLLNSSNSTDHARAVAKAELAVDAYEQIGRDEGRVLPQLEEAKALRGNAMLEFFSSLLKFHKRDLDAAESPLPALRERSADAAKVLAWLKTATYQAGYAPPISENVHRKFLALIGTLTPIGEDGRAASGELVDGYIAALDLLERFELRNLLPERPAEAPASADAWTPTQPQIDVFMRAVRARTSPGETLTHETLMRAARPLELDAVRLGAVISALAAKGRILALTSGTLVYFDLFEQALEDRGGLAELSGEVVDGIKLANAPGAANALRAVAKLNEARSKYRLTRKGDAEQASIALGNAKLEAITGALWHHEKALAAFLEGTRPAWNDLPLDEAARHLAATRMTLALLSPVYYSAERRQDISASLAAGLAEIATLDVLREAAGAELDAGSAYGAFITREWIERLKSGERSGSTPRDKNPYAPAGDLDSKEGLQVRMEAIGMPAAIREIAAREYANLEQMDPRDGEAQKLRAYLEWLVEMPWSVRTEDSRDVAAAREILDRDHAGLERVKERVLEFLALRKKTGSKKGAIIAFTGPPGTGKTSIASSIAQALGRKFVRLSLGGVHDESVLRGHGRTYTGSMPGEIMRQMKNAGTINPVMLMDEVDKIGRNGAHGDPTAALLEILDPEQNSTFRDRYLDVPYDLSEVLFVVTSNEISNIPGPLRDRMEIIEFDGYTTLEKLAIAERHVVPQKRDLAGLKPEEASITKGALRAIIEGYTMEAGVRGLREKIETLLRKVSAWTETRGEPAPAVVDEGDVAKYLGVPRFSASPIAQNGVGVATGLAVDGYGGSTLNVEVSKEPGTGQLKLRKQFGDDIEDSAKNAYKYVKLHAAELGLEGYDFTTIDVDINITPAGKVDGPSAGGLMVTAIVSALTGRPVKAGVAMTGEITMRGDILPIGGLKQKVMAAHRMGYAEVIFPWANLKDIEGIPQEVRDGIKLTPARTYDDIFPAAF